MARLIGCTLHLPNVIQLETFTASVLYKFIVVV